MQSLQWRGAIAAPPEGLGTGITDLMAVARGAQDFVVSTTQKGGGMLALSLIEGQLATLSDSLFFTPASAPAVSGRLAEAGLSVVYGAAPGSALQGVALDQNGRFGAMGEVPLPGVSGGPGALLAAASGGYLYMAGRDAGGGFIGCYSAGGTGGYVAGEVIRDTAASHLAAPVALKMATVAGRDFLMSLCGSERGVSVWSVDAADGSLSLTGTLGAADGLGILAAPVAMELAQAGGRSFAIVASASGSGDGAALSVMEIDATGALLPADHVLDSRETRFGLVQSLATVEAGGWTYVLAAGGDDGVSLFTLMPNGQLVHLDTLVHETGRRLSDIRALEAVRVGGEIQVLVASEESDRLVGLSFSLGDQGSVITADGARAGTTRDDMLFGGAGSDTLRGGDGDDILWDGAGRDTLEGQGGADTYVLAFDGVTDRIVGFSPQQDRLDLSRLPMFYDPALLTVETTNWGARVIWKGEVLEVYSADGAGLDRAAILPAVSRGVDRPLLQLNIEQPQPVPEPEPEPEPKPEPEPQPAPENLFLSGSEGADTITGGAGNDTLESFGGDDRLIGGDGNDLFHSGEGDDTVYGGNGRDRGYLFTGNDVFYDTDEAGSAGSDVIYVGPGDDTVYGRGGNDIFHGLGGHDVIEGSEGNDTIYAGTGHDLVYGNEGNDELWGGIGHDTVSGGDGDDLIFARDGYDLLDGGAGNDTLWAGPGNDTVTGGEGRDRGYLGPGDDIFHDGDSQGGWAGGDVIYVGPGDDTAFGGEGDDVFHGLGGMDWLEGGAGNDTLYGGTDADFLFGGDGDDVVWGGMGMDLAELGGGNDLFRDTPQSGPLGRDTVDGGDGDDTILGSGGDDLFSGGAGNDSIEGGRGLDTLRGQRGDDFLSGGEGHDLIVGGDGADRLSGDEGLDTLVGGEGADIFVFRAGQGLDRIQDYEPGIDSLLLSLPGGGPDALAFDDGAAGLRIGWAGGGVVLEGLSQEQFDTGDIHFF